MPADGRLRLRPFLDLADPGDRAKLEPLASRVHDIIIEAGGTISSASGCGLARTQFLRKQYGELVQVFREIKDAFDPQNQLNPGKVIGDDPHLMLRNLKPWPEVPAEAIDRTVFALVVAWDLAARATRRKWRDQGRDRAAGNRDSWSRNGEIRARARRAVRGAR